MGSAILPWDMQTEEQGIQDHHKHSHLRNSWGTWRVPAISSEILISTKGVSGKHLRFSSCLSCAPAYMKSLQVSAPTLPSVRPLSHGKVSRVERTLRLHATSLIPFKADTSNQCYHIAFSRRQYSTSEAWVWNQAPSIQIWLHQLCELRHYLVFRSLCFITERC